ncbi:hypothetical protein CJ255_11840 [Candidatus Viridilinea mediisalina]|uniref:NACHT domain-containing protein n=2 Tax=Candidatus Viridilinea mediisalina TaxID=2024553 RepID=A0A2A6RII7_9CHLR|nr:hypothetical protein CJ255_11840 [Candidatus Viridilinea mediisalina]
MEIVTHFEGRFIMLGDPGLGKSTILFAIMHHLLQNARNDVNLPIPVLVNLSSWQDPKQQFQTWLAEQIAVTYQLPRQLMLDLITNDRIFPLLDGLNEVREGYQKRCIDAINLYLRLIPRLPAAPS